MTHDNAGLHRAFGEAADTFATPPREFGMMPFWMLNDDLDDDELLRQVREFHDKGFGGFIPHARVGLSRRVGYLTDEWFRIMLLLADEAAKLGMKICLYDEGSYPSGSACGRVVAANPSHAARCLISRARQVDGPTTGYWRPNGGRSMSDRLVAVVIARVVDGALVPESARALEVVGRELVRYDVPDGRWQLTAVLDVFSGGSIRGVHDEQDDSHPLAPPAGDLLKHDAVASFLRITHDAYYEHLKEHFGTTVVAMFTDEPNLLGRGARRGDMRPFTEGFLDDVRSYWDEDVERWLPALWHDVGPRTDEFRKVWSKAAQDRMEWVFYGAQGGWCEDHGIALTGHPPQSDEMSALKYFGWPGQDMVWRYIEPDSPKALEGAHSTAAKAASSATTLLRKPRSASEVCGAYGWRLSLDETKWLFDWHLVRGNNTFFPHAVFYSIRDRRAYESEPDLGVHNVWWPYFDQIADYVRRVSWVLSEGTPVQEVAILTDPNELAWTAAKVLFQHQIDFLYLDEQSVRHAPVEDGRMWLGEVGVRAVVCDPVTVPESVHEAVEEFRRAGGLVVESWSADTLADILTAHAAPDVVFTPDAGSRREDLRVTHYRKSGLDHYFLVNEGEAPISGFLSLSAVGAVAALDPTSGEVREWPAHLDAGRTRCPLRLERRQGLVLSVDSSATPATGATLPPVPGSVVAEINGPWEAHNPDGRTIDVPAPGDWASVIEWEMFSGTITYYASVELTEDAAGKARFLDLGSVGEIAEVFINGTHAGVRPWAPYVLPVDGLMVAGRSELEVRVTNSMANEFEGMRLPSGLLGPVVLRDAEVV